MVLLKGWREGEPGRISLLSLHQRRENFVKSLEPVWKIQSSPVVQWCLFLRGLVSRRSEEAMILKPPPSLSPAS